MHACTHPLLWIMGNKAVSSMECHSCVQYLQRDNKVCSWICRKKDGEIGWPGECILGVFLEQQYTFPCSNLERWTTVWSAYDMKHSTIGNRPHSLQPHVRHTSYPHQPAPYTNMGATIYNTRTFTDFWLCSQYFSTFDLKCNHDCVDKVLTVSFYLGVFTSILGAQCMKCGHVNVLLHISK